MTPRTAQETKYGFMAALSSFLLWGLLPIYWKSLVSVSPFEILCHRIIWSLLFIAVILTAKKRWLETFSPLKSPKNIGILILSSLCIGSNWLLYIWAVNSGHILETSLGYYINPLVNVMFGFAFFKERPSRMQYIAIGLATMGVINSVISYGELPWISLLIAMTFALYGVLRKIAVVESLPGLFLETAILTPVALYYLLHLNSMGQLAFLNGPPRIDLLLVGAGAITALPLIGFAFGARRLRLTTLGILQYASPSIAFTLGVCVYNEPFGIGHLVTFGFIWSGLAVYTVDSVRTLRKQRKLAKQS